MAEKTPVRVVFNESNVATGLAEFQSGDAVGVAFGGTGLNAIGSAGQILKVNAAGTALEFGAEGDISITNLVAPTNADLSLTTSGTGNIVLNDLSISDNSISTNRSNDDLKINASGTGTVVLENLKIGTSGSTVTTILDEDNLGSDSATSLATQQSIKAYVDSQLGGADLDFQADSGGALAIDLDSETMTFTGGTGIDTSGSGNTVTFAIDSTVATLTGSQTLTNKVITSPTISGPTITGTATIGAVTTNSISSNGSNADISIQPSGTGDVLISALRVNGTTLDSSDSTKITIAEALDVTGTLTNASVAITGGSITGITDLAVADGGTGASTFTDGGVLLGSGTGAITAMTVLSDGEMIVGDGTGDPVAESGATLRTSIGVGTGDSPQFTGIELGHATDTTITRASSGDLNIEGNLIYRAGGTDVPVADGGTGASSLTANAVLTGNGTSAITAEGNLSFDGSTLAVTGAVTISGDLTVSGDTATVSTTNTTIEDNIIQLNTGISQSLNDAGIIIERGSTGDNAAIIWDESADTFVLGTTSADADDKSGGITIAAGSLKIASLEVDGITITDNNLTTNASNSTLELEANGTGDIDLNAGADVNLPANIGLTFGDDGEKIEGDGTNLTVTSSNNVTIDATGSIFLSADGNGLVDFKDGDLTYLRVSESSNNAFLKNMISDGDVIIKGNDGGSEVTALTLDMSEAGAATFNSSVTVGGAMTSTSVTANDFTSNGSNADITIAPQGTGDINLTAGADINIPADIGLTFGNDAEKIEGDGTDLTITGNNIKLTATTDVIIPTNVGLHFTDANEKIESDGSKLVITSGGTAFNLPTADGTDGQALVTDGSGTLSFSAVGDASASDDSNASAVSNKRITSTARAIDSFGETFQDSVLYYVCTNDHHLDMVNMQKVNLAHNDTGPFVTSSGATSGTGDMTTFTSDSSNNVIRLKAASTNAVGGNVSFYKFGLGDNSTAATSGNIIVTQNTDVDSASEAVTSFAHADFRGAKLFISVNNNAKTEVTNMEAIVVHDGTTAYITTYNVVNTGNNTLATFTAAISGDNVVISAGGLEPNLRVTVHAIMLKDTMTANAGTFANSEAIAPVTISSSATAFDTLEQKTTNGAVYYLVSKNATEGHFAINEVLVAFGSDNITTANGGYVSTKATNQIAVTSEIKDDTELTGEIKISSTSGGSTTVSAYMIKLHAS